MFCQEGSGACQHPNFKVAYNCQSNELKNSKYGQKIAKESPNFQISCRLQMVSKVRDFWQGER